GLYRYPHQMIGRKLPTNLDDKKSDILIFAAHPDDEVIGLSATLQRYKRSNQKVTVVYVTDGTGRDMESLAKGKELAEQVAARRYGEGIKALSLINIQSANIFCLGFPDAGIHRYLKEIATDVQLLLEKLQPNKVYVHCMEGGHNDHDLVSLVVKSVCHHLNYDNVYEWAEYNQVYPLGTTDMKFPAPLSHHQEKEMKINLSEEELNLKKQMLACHQSQNVVNVFTQGEIIRKAHLTNLKEELIAYSQVAQADWFYLVNNFLKYMDEERKHPSGALKPNNTSKRVIN